jgi:hypothetical protein
VCCGKQEILHFHAKGQSIEASGLHQMGLDHFVLSIKDNYRIPTGNLNVMPETSIRPIHENYVVP